MYGYIYKTINLINNKIYIGQHKSQEFNPHYFGSGVNILRALKKYGKNNFKVELLEWCESREELDNKEILYIDQFSSVDSEIGYNITFGGQERFFTGMTHSNSSKSIMSEKAKLRPHPPTTKGRISITNGIDNKMIDPNDYLDYKDLGWYKGKTTSGKPAWNKGLTKETDKRIEKYTINRNKHFLHNNYIGFCKSGVDSPNYKSNEYLIENYLDKGFKDIYLDKGKSFVCSYFHISGNIYNRLMSLCGFDEEFQKIHSSYIRSKSRKQLNKPSELLENPYNSDK